MQGNEFNVSKVHSELGRTACNVKVKVNVKVEAYSSVSIATLRAQDWSRLRIQSLLYRSQGPLGKDYFRTTIFFPANFVTLLAVI